MCCFLCCPAKYWKQFKTVTIYSEMLIAADRAVKGPQADWKEF